MNKNVYDVFRTVAQKRATCFDTRSAAFITQGKLSKDIYHKRKNKNIKAGLVYRYQEGPDEAIVYTFKKDDLRKGDYFVYDHTDYLVYEDQKLIDENVDHKKHRAVECNVSFTYKNEIYKGYFVSTLRRKNDPDLESKQVLMPNEMPLLILPTNELLTINSIFTIQDKPWKIAEYDNITNKGITYYYIERDFTRKGEEEEVVEVASFISELEIIEQEEPIIQMFSRFLPSEEENGISTLRSSLEYSFKTEDAYFSATPKVNITYRDKTLIKFEIPFGITEISISTKNNGIIVEEIYKVVL